jgi:hypothetical protein
MSNQTILNRMEVIRIANEHATAVLQNGSRPYIEHFIHAIEEALALAQTNVGPPLSRCPRCSIVGPHLCKGKP